MSGAMTQGVQRDHGRSAPDNAAMDQGMRVLSYLISGVLFYGALGWVGDHFLHTKFLLPIGILLGAGLGIYLTIKRLQASELASPSNDVTEGER
ncbi:AtpZ/AtpI family protein [Microlunatus antarcticus]|uniref:F0F1-type ATP synthase assembly protein I n=1 Tax=Microlunatus antarcticus TaxID=53388 RepID=A0A7W5JW79_9ACTN|nr:F0F1-type ATP synthase assembly protein I [Microlunatus antarcticus]